MKFIVEIIDSANLAGITAAREAYNANLPADAEPLTTDETYVQFVMSNAAQSYTRQYVK